MGRDVWEAQSNVVQLGTGGHQEEREERVTHSKERGEGREKR
jgi:hypothetical protein